MILENIDGTAEIALDKPVPSSGFELSFDAMRISSGDFGSVAFPIGQQHCVFYLGGWDGSIVGIGNMDGANAYSNETTRRNTPQQPLVRGTVTHHPRPYSGVDQQIGAIDLPTSGHVFVSDNILCGLGFYAWKGKAAIRSIRLRQMKPGGTRRWPKTNRRRPAPQLTQEPVALRISSKTCPAIGSRCSGRKRT